MDGHNVDIIPKMKLHLPPYLQRRLDAETFVKLSGRLVDILVDIDQEIYMEYVTVANGGKVMYLELMKAHYIVEINLVMNLFCFIITWNELL